MELDLEQIFLDMVNDEFTEDKAHELLRYAKSLEAVSEARLGLCDALGITIASSDLKIKELERQLSTYKDNVVAEFSGVNNSSDNIIYITGAAWTTDSILEDQNNDIYLVSCDKRIVIKETYKVIILKQTK